MSGTVALIPARGGSKGIPGKNLARVGGRSLVARSVLHARAAAAIDDVYVSTDDDAIAAEARRAGARVIERPAALAGDTASTESAIEHALRWWDDAKVAAQRVVLLQCTSPFRASGQLDAALAQFDASRCDSMFSGVPFHGFVWVPDEEGGGMRPTTYDPARRPRRQEIGDVFLETGSFYIFRRELFERLGARLGGRIEVFAVPESDRLEIDSPADLAHARLLAARRGDRELLAGVSYEWLILDVDGTLTDAAMFYGEAGEELKRFHTHDGAGLARWKAAGGKVAWITGERSEAARRRAEKLRVDHLVLGSRDKAADLQAVIAEHGLDRTRLVAMGDDLPDLAMIPHAGLFVAPAGARDEVLARADLVTESRGGHGAVRELVDLLLASGCGP